MKLQRAQSIIHEVHGKQYSWLKAWGISTIKEAIYTIFHRVSSTSADLELAEDVERRILEGQRRGW